jgi:hypothetical protein
VWKNESTSLKEQLKEARKAAETANPARLAQLEVDASPKEGHMLRSTYFF